ncbi:hypothetical protein [Iningainema tapete]|uniref:Uncharacterized protein n=1 Tax=Iningainema tapete BLCC-T55 TaxID=2748662 RepID=A0A8J6XG93_9CYAN|nr:hypothetical protein [Iningainema tapete]MBD2771139.1 hypothetical protein [Iningainema tapete BLCC-T55]
MIITVLALVFVTIASFLIAVLASLVLAMKIAYVAEEILEEEERHD